MKVYLATPHTYKSVLDECIYGFSEQRGGGGYVYNSDLGKKEMKIFLAGLDLGNIPKQDKMDLYLAGLNAEDKRANRNGDFSEKIFVLESFYYMKDWMLPYINDHWHFLLDSGAFTFMNDKKNSKGIDWEGYLSSYTKFINDHDIKLFFELDIDSIVGIKEVERLRRKLEARTNKKCIPVWHKSRGLAYWKKMCKDYDYVSIGGIVTGEIKKSEYSIFTNLLKIAKENNCKVHGLGFTNEIGLKKYKFYSVDSTAWIYGNRGGFLYRFNGTWFDKISVPKGKRMKGKEVAIHNFKEWVKLQKYAKTHL